MSGVLCAVAAMLPTPASAAVTASTITSPTNDAEFYVDTTDATSTATAFTVSGTVTGTGTVDVVCVDAYAGTSYVLASSVSLSAGSFSTAITQQALFNTIGSAEHSQCILRAMPHGSAGTGLAPGVPTPFSGPIVGVASQSFQTSSGTPVGFFAILPALASSGTTGVMQFDAAGGCGLVGSWLSINTPSLPGSQVVLGCDGGIFHAYKQYPSGLYTPDEIMVDSADAALGSTFNGINPATPGFEAPTFASGFAGGELTLEDDEPVMLCASACVSTPPTAGYTSAGVELSRTWQAEASGLVALQTDVFKSTDGQAHTVSVLEDESAFSNGDAALEFPGASGFSAYAVGDTVQPPSGAAAIYVKTDQTTPDAGDPGLTWGHAAIVYTKTPTAPIVFTYGTTADPEFYLPYTLQVPAGGTAVVRFAYVQDFALSDVKALAQQALTSFDPTLTLSEPANNAAVSSPLVTVGGTATDIAGIKTVTVDGSPVTVNSAGAFSTPLTLTVGSNTITVVATDTDGLTATQTASVTVAEPTASSGTVTRRSIGGLGTALRPRTDRKFPYVYTLEGKLPLPAGVSSTQGCAGKITLTVRRGRRKILAKTATVSQRCKWSARLRLAKHKLVPRHGKLTITVAFGGNAAINPYTARPLTVQYGHR